MSNTSPWGAAELRLAGDMLYGTREWQSQLARDLEVNSSTVRRWLAGTRQISEATWDQIAEIARRRTSDLAQLLEQMATEDSEPSAAPATKPANPARRRARAGSPRSSR